MYIKNRAVNHGWRIPEKTLQLTALLGGWAGGIVCLIHITIISCIMNNYAVKDGHEYV
jgi:hypothetical protein